MAEDKTMADKQQQAKAASAPKSGRGLAWLALLLALAAGGGSGYLLYQEYLRQQAPPPWQDDITGMLAILEAQTEQLSRLADAQASAVRDQRQAQQAALAEQEARFDARLLEALGSRPPGRRAWQLAELEYLLRLANQRLQLAGDARAALRLLEAADQQLVALDDPGFYPLRRTLAGEQRALREALQLDREGLFLTLEVLKRDVQDLPLALPNYRRGREALATEVEAETVEETGFWAGIWQRLRGLFEFRRLDGPGVQPLLGPAQAQWLALHLQLMLERAQLALLQQDALVYQQSLTTVQEYLVLYLDPAQVQVQQVRTQLGALLATDIAPPLPDISASLQQLLAKLEDEA